MRKLIMLMVICITITGCSTINTQETVEDVEEIPVQQETEEIDVSNEIETVEEMPTLEDIDVIIEEEAVPMLPLEISVNTLENTYEEENTVLAHVKIDYPILQNKLEEEGITKINQFFAEAAHALYEENNTYASDNVELIKEQALADNNSQDCYSEYSVTFEVTYNANGYLSVLESFREENYDTENLNSYSTGYVFDVQTGERLTKNDILEGTEEEIAQVIGQTFMESDKISEEVKQNCKEEIVANTQYAEVYMDDRNINFFYNPYTVAPYSEGILEAYIPLDTKELLKININK